MSPVAIALMMLLPATVVGQPFAFVMDVLNSKFSACYMQLFEQSVNNLSIQNNTDTTQISFSTGLTSLAISSCASTSIEIQTQTGALSFSTALAFDGGDEATCLNSIASNSLGLATVPTGSSSCYCNQGLNSFMTSYTSESNIVCNVSVYTTWSGNVNNKFEITYTATENPAAYPDTIFLNAFNPSTASNQKPAAVKVEKKSDAVVAAAGGDQYTVDMYVLLDQFAGCVPSLFSQNVNNLKATNESTSVYVTFSTSLTSIDVSKCNFLQIGIQGSSPQSTLATGLIFQDQTDCSSSVESNSVSVSSPGSCDYTVCNCGYNCATNVITGLSTSSTDSCSIDLDVSWLTGSGTPSTTHVYNMLSSPTAYPVSFSVDV